MPYFVPEDLEVEPWEYVNSCSKSEIKELIEALTDEGHLLKYSSMTTTTSQVSLNEQMFREALDKISEKYLNLSSEQEEYIINLAKQL